MLGQFRACYLALARSDGPFYVGRGPPAGLALLGSYYPRGGMLGGSLAVNAISTIYPREIFLRLENSHYLTPGTPGHGFGGYLDTIMRNGSAWVGEDDLVSVLGTASGHLG